MYIDCRQIIDPPAPGPRNMAVDEALLIDSAENGTATLRFYSWIEPTLSLGYFQRYTDRQQHAASSKCAVVRRQTGGGAILHDRELTYSLSLPGVHPLAKQNEKLYRIVHEVFVEILPPLNQLPESDCRLQIRGQATNNQTSNEPFLCFERQSAGDVIFLTHTTLQNDVALSRGSAPAGSYKILGSAQRRYHGAVLQHGSLLLEGSAAAPELKGWRDLTGLKTAANAIISLIAPRLSEALSLRIREAKLLPELESIATQITNNKYGSPDWTKRR